MTPRVVIQVAIDANQPGPMPCAFCHQQTEFEDNRHMIDGRHWKCACGATGMSCIPADLDEASEQWFRVLGIADVRFGESAVPVGTSGQLSARYYDSPKLLGQLTSFFEGRGHRVLFQEVGVIFRTLDGRELPEHTRWLFWIAPTPMHGNG
jgi:hypothetical protein